MHRSDIGHAQPRLARLAREGEFKIRGTARAQNDPAPPPLPA